MSITTVIRIHIRTAQSQAQTAVLKAASLSLQSIGFRITDLTLQATSPRIVAEDNGGRAFVVEAMPDGRFRAEILGTADGSCVRIMREFVEGLRRQAMDVQVPQVDPMKRGWRLTIESHEGPVTTIGPEG